MKKVLIKVNNSNNESTTVILYLVNSKINTHSVNEIFLKGELVFSATFCNNEFEIIRYKNQDDAIKIFTLVDIESANITFVSTYDLFREIAQEEI